MTMLNLNIRTKIFLENWIQNLKKHKSKFELIIVEWNNIKKRKIFLKFSK